MQTTQVQQHDYFAQGFQLVEASAHAVVVTDDEQQQAAVTWLGQAKTCLKVLVEMRSSALAPHKERMRSIEAEHDAMITPLKAAMERVRKVVDDYATLLMRRRQEAEAQRQREVETARLKAAQEEEEQAAAKRREAEQARQIGDTRSAAIAEHQAEQHENAAQATLEHAIAAPAPAPPAPFRVGTAAGTLHAGASWVHELIDIDQVPADLVTRELRLALVKERIKDLVRNGKLKDGAIYTDLIPGLRISQQAKTRLY